MNIGMILIWAAFLMGSLAAGSAFAGYFKRQSKAQGRKFKALSEKLEFACGITVLAATFLLTLYVLWAKTAYVYVFQHSSADLAWYYRFSALWAGEEGSFLLWTCFIFLMLILIRKGKTGIILKDTELLNLTRGVALTIASIFLLLLLLKNPFSTYYLTPSGVVESTNWNPFVEVFVVPYGQGMNPLLRNPWMAIHPPVLFLGYAAFTLPFSAAFAGLMLGDKRWLELSNSWMRVSWFFLTLGIGFGGFWAYEVLGWGAWYWSWDPVETSSLIPWLSATAYLHAKLRADAGEYRFLLPFLAIGSFILVISSTFVTRSGLWASVHSWQDFTSQGKVIAFFLSGLLISSTGLLLRHYWTED
ncbi:MAG: cytochrome c biogenesis protein CcsA [Methanosarcinaceae archaeon]|nr:cytochrome c biogenesis protein CcsA [Methanosarcinaceae archaeon]